VDRVGEWRLVDSEESEDPGEPGPTIPAVDQAQAGGPSLILIGGVATAVLAIAGLAIWLTLPQPTVQLDLRGAAVQIDGEAGQEPVFVTTPPPADAAEILVDVEGAVLSPGLHRLPAESRVGDAIAAAGGYSPRVDIAVAASRLNLAERLADGAKVHVPALGEAAVTVQQQASQATTTASGSGLIDVNHATAEGLDTLPGIGPVTAAKIIAAREEAPFATVDELLSRGVLGPVTFENLKELVTVTP
jgi:competence protein ComEA